MNVWKPNVQLRNEFSISQLWIINDDDDQNANTIEAGWMVRIYRFFCAISICHLFMPLCINCI